MNGDTRETLEALVKLLARAHVQRVRDQKSRPTQPIPKAIPKVGTAA